MIRAVADAHGVCEVRAIGAPRGEIWGYAPGYQESKVDRFETVDGVEGATLKMIRAARVVGRVVRDADGTPAAGLSVHAASGLRSESNWPHGHATTDADGHYAIDGAQGGDVLVYAEGPGWFTKGASPRGALSGPIHALDAGQTTTIDLRVVPAGLVRGRIFDAEGHRIRLGEVADGARRHAVREPGLSRERIARQSPQRAADAWK